MFKHAIVLGDYVQPLVCVSLYLKTLHELLVSFQRLVAWALSNLSNKKLCRFGPTVRICPASVPSIPRRCLEAYLVQKRADHES